MHFSLVASHVLPDLGELLMGILITGLGVVALIAMIVFAVRAKPKSKDDE